VCTDTLKQCNKQHKIASFPTLSLFLEDADGVDFSEIKDDVITQLTKPSLRFKEYFPELERSIYQWIVNPFLSDLTEIPDNVNGFAEQLMELRSSSQCKMLFEEKKDHLESFWLTIHNEYPISLHLSNMFSVQFVFYLQWVKRTF
jgi:hypothetical protein